MKKITGIRMHNGFVFRGTHPEHSYIVATAAHNCVMCDYRLEIDIVSPLCAVCISRSNFHASISELIWEEAEE